MRFLSVALAVWPTLAWPATFPPPAIELWAAHSFSGETAYRTGSHGGEAAVHARCDAAASGLFRDEPVDLTRTPIIEWRWRVDQVAVSSAPERSKPGDDFAARLYVVRDGGMMMWRTRALNYVWARHEPRGADWPNPFAAQARMIALRSAGDVGAWHTERRNLREDFRRYHGIEVDRIDAVAIMTDCDNGRGMAEAWYGTIRFLPAD